MTGPSTPGLAARVLAAIEETERIAAAARDELAADKHIHWPENADRWTSGAIYMTDTGHPTDYDVWFDNDCDATVVSVNTSRQACGQHIARQDPKATRRRCAADRDLVAEVQSWEHRDCEDSQYACPQAVLPGCVDPCDCGTDSRRAAVLGALAAVYGITTEAPCRGGEGD